MARSGNTLIEVVIAVLLVGIMVTGMMSVAVTGHGSGRVTHRAAAALAGQNLLDALKAYVTADQTLVKGPGSGAGQASWRLPGDSCGCYALASGMHALDASLWLTALAGAPYQGTISYTVTNAATPNGDQPTVALSIAWTEP